LEAAQKLYSTFSAPAANVELVITRETKASANPATDPIKGFLPFIRYTLLPTMPEMLLGLAGVLEK